MLTGEQGNQYVGIYVDRKLENKCASHNAPEVLSCDSFDTFWLQWSDNALKVGRGHVAGSQQITECETSQPLDIRGVSVGSAMGEEAYWQFEDVTNGKLLHATLSTTLLS